MRKLTKKLCALLAAALIVGAVPAAALDTAREDCSMTVTLADEAGLAANHGELGDAAAAVALYRAADVDAAYNYAPAAGFESLSAAAYAPEDGEAVTLDIAGYKDMEAGEQSALAAAAAELAAGMTADASAQAENGAVTFTGLKTGLYLVMAETVEAGEHEYSFAPVLVSLPSMNDSYETGADGENHGGEDMYDVALTMKPEAAPLYGTLTLTKTLETFSQGPAAFVFQVEATVENEADMLRPRSVYSDVISLVFDGPGTQSVDVELPLGAAVTVTEIYSGAGYALADEATRTQTVKLGWTEDADGAAALVTAAETEFVNTYDGSLITGSSVENHFSRDENGGWVWQGRYDDGRVQTG